ncbi:MAG: RNA-binding cell elongation regulator Jag/EloR [Anaerolineae bacterium]
MENDSIQVSAATVEEAIKKGLASLGLARDRVTVQVVDHGSRGLLGLGARDAIVRLIPIAAQANEPQATPSTVPTRATEPPAVAETVSAPVRPRPAPAAQDAVDVEWTPDQVAETARQTLSELLGKMGIEAQVHVRQPEGKDSESAPLTLDIEGESLDILIGNQGKVLNSLQYITRLIVSREVERWVNLVVDVDHYKQRRAKSLQELANRIAERVARTQQPVALEPMPPNERRAIHIALRDHPSVTTQSVGKGDSRKVTIIPKR